MTMASTVYGPYTDEAYVPGKEVDKMIRNLEKIHKLRELIIMRN